MSAATTVLSFTSWPHFAIMATAILVHGVIMSTAAMPVSIVSASILIVRSPPHRPDDDLSWLPQ
eukprot:4411837-Pyramimonas_sp.AAC.1